LGCLTLSTSYEESKVTEGEPSRASYHPWETDLQAALNPAISGAHPTFKAIVMIYEGALVGLALSYLSELVESDLRDMRPHTSDPHEEGGVLHCLNILPE
jgi:hypothetical protein